MKKHTFLFFLLFVGYFSSAQKNDPGADVILFEKALLLQQLVNDDLQLNRGISSGDSLSEKAAFEADMKEIILEKSLFFYDNLIEQYPNSKLLYRALNNKAYILLNMDEVDEAEEIFLLILDSKLNDAEKGGVGTGIMAEPYANYKNRAAKTLARLSIEKKDYKSALEYLNLTHKYVYRHFCGNEYAADKIYVAELYAQCYIGLKDFEKATEVLLPELMNNALTDNTDLVNLAYQVLMETYSREELSTKYEEAFRHYEVETVKTKKYEYQTYHIVFLGRKIGFFPPEELEFLSADKQAKSVDRIYRESPLYVLLNK